MRLYLYKFYFFNNYAYNWLPENLFCNALDSNLTCFSWLKASSKLFSWNRNSENDTKQHEKKNSN